MVTHSSILAWRIPWTEEPGGLQSMGLHTVGHARETEHACARQARPLLLADELTEHRVAESMPTVMQLLKGRARIQRQHGSRDHILHCLT